MVDYIVQQRRRLRLHLLLSLLILLAFGLRLHNVDGFSFWTDEGLTPLRSSYPIPEILSNRITIQGWPTKDTHPPFFYLVIHYSRKLLGETDFAFRYVSLLSSILLIPLLFQFGRKLRGDWTGLTAALLTSINPLHVWYANEARMYMLLMLLVASATYVLWRALLGHDLKRSLLLYFIFAGLAFYTHYTAVFIIGSHAIFWAWLLWRNGQRRLLLGTAVIGLLALIPVIPYTIPRLFTGAEANYFYVPPLVMLQDVVFGFSLGVTTPFDLFSTKLLIVGALGLLITGFVTTRTGWMGRAFLFTYLLAVVFGLMAGSIIKPMYQGVRHIMVGSPAFLLLLAEGIVWLATAALKPRKHLQSFILKSLAVGATAVLLLGPASALNNFYNDPYYVKNDFRSLIRYTEEKAGSKDVVVYNNAILLPLHEHYQTRHDIAVTASPVYPQFSTTSPEQLEDLARKYDRIWFVTDPPADKRDEEALVRNWLDTNLYIVDQRNFPGRTTEVKVLAYATAPQIMEHQPENSEPLSLQWGSLPLLDSVQLNFEQPSTMPTLWLDLFWEGSIPFPPNIRLRFSLQGPNGREWASHTHALNSQPATPLEGGQFVRQSYFLPVPAGTPPGEYALFVQPVSELDDAILGQNQSIATVALATSNDWPIVPDWPFSNLASIQFDNGLSLQAIHMASEEVRPGHNLPMTLYWQAENNLTTTNTQYHLDVINSDGSLLRTQNAQPGATWLAEWEAGTVIKESGGIYFPPHTEPGSYRLRWKLLDGDVAVPGRRSWQPWMKENIYYEEIQVIPWPFTSELPEEVTLVKADYGLSIQLYGYDLAQPIDDTLDLTLYWQVQKTLDKDYFTFVHLVSVKTGEIISQIDSVPVNGLRPTKGWRVNEVLTDRYSLKLPSELQEGQYQLITGLFVPQSGERLPVVHQGEPQANNQLVLTTITLP